MPGNVQARRRLRKLGQRISDQEQIVDFYSRQIVRRTVDCSCRAMLGLSIDDVRELGPQLVESLRTTNRAGLAALIREDPHAVRKASEKLGVVLPPWPTPDFRGFVLDYEKKHGRTLFETDQFKEELQRLSC